MEIRDRFFSGSFQHEMLSLEEIFSKMPFLGKKEKIFFVDNSSCLILFGRDFILSAK
jgi:hypothetical protein